MELVESCNAQVTNNKPRNLCCILYRHCNDCDYKNIILFHLFEWVGDFLLFLVAAKMPFRFFFWLASTVTNWPLRNNNTRICVMFNNSNVFLRVKKVKILYIEWMYGKSKRGHCNYWKLIDLSRLQVEEALRVGFLVFGIYVYINRRHRWMNDLCNNWIRATVFDWWDVRYRGPPSLSNTATASPNSLQLFIYSNTCCLSSIECVAPSILPTHKIRFEHSLPTSASVTVHFYTSFIINFRFEWRK